MRCNKQFFSAALTAAFALGLVGCGGADRAPAPAKNNAGLSIVTTIFPEYDWVRELTAGTEADITLLLDNGVDLHSYQPTAADLITISGCDLFVYVGGTSDAWVEDALGSAANPQRKTIDLLEILGDAVREEEQVEGMTAEFDSGESEHEYDEHVWLSLQNADRICGALADALAEMDPDNAATYRANAGAYCQQLTALDQEFADTAANAAYDTLLFGDRFPFRYLTEDYGLQYYAAFSGCSAETEASFETVLFLANKLEELHLPAVLTLEGSDGRLAQTIVDSTADKNQKILSMDSMQSTTGTDAQKGVTYLSLMEKNLDVLKEALQ